MNGDIDDWVQRTSNGEWRCECDHLEKWHYSVANYTDTECRWCAIAEMKRPGHGFIARHAFQRVAPKHGWPS